MAGNLKNTRTTTPLHDRTEIDQSGKIAFYLHNLNGGGAERVTLTLASEFVRMGYTVHLIVDEKSGAYANQVPPGIEVFELNRSTRFSARLAALRAYPNHLPAILRPVLLARKPAKYLQYLPALADYLRRERPANMIAAMFENNLIAIWARQLSGNHTRLLVTQHNTISKSIEASKQMPKKRWRMQYIPGIIQRCYPKAEAIVAVSDGVADDLAYTCNLNRRSITTVYNPVVSDKLLERSAQPLAHPWFQPGQPPVLLGIGRLEPQKDFANLIDAFATVRLRKPIRLVILGEGSLRHALEQRAQQLGCREDVDLPGWVDNPYPYINLASMLIVSSRFEGLSMVLIEALACGCNVVSTDCPNGPSEILDGGRYGRLVPIAKAGALSEAILKTLDQPTRSSTLIKRSKHFNVAKIAQQYLELLSLDSYPPNTVSTPRILNNDAI